MHTRLAETMDFVEEQRRSLLESFHGVPIERLSRRAGTDGWSVAEILDHLQIVESGVARLIAKRVAKARETGLGDETSTASVMSSFDQHQARLDSAKMQAPEMVRPRSDVDPAAAVHALEDSRQALRSAVRTADGLAIGEIRHNHAILGELDLYQWLIFLGQHERRHTRQIERTLKSIPE